MTLNKTNFHLLRVGDKLQWILPSEEVSDFYLSTGKQTDVVVTNIESAPPHLLFEYNCIDGYGYELINQVWYISSPPYDVWEWVNSMGGGLGELKWFGIWRECLRTRDERHDS